MYSRKTPAPPELRPLRLPHLVAGDAARIYVHGKYDAQQFTGSDLEGIDLTDTRFSGCSFAGIGTAELELTSARIVDTALTRLNVPAVSAAYATLRNVVFEESRVGVLQCIEGSWDAVHLRQCKIGYLNLREATVRDLLFTDCVIDELDLAGAEVERVAFSGSGVNFLDVTDATLNDVDLRALVLPDISGLAHLKGATLNYLQLHQLAPSLAAHIGIGIED